MGGVIGIELNLLEEIIRNIIRQEMKVMGDEIKQTLISKRESLFKEERLYTNQVAEILDVCRRTVAAYRKQGYLPEPKFDLTGRPYWTPTDLENVLKRKGIMAKFEV